MNKERLAVSFIFFINGFTYGSWVSRLPKFQEEYGMDNGMLGIVLLVHAIGALFSMPLAGWLIVRNGSQRITLFSLFIFCSLTAFLPMMPNIMTLAIWLGIMGILSGVLDVSMNAQAVLVEQRADKPIMSSFHAFFSIGMMVGAGLGSFFVYLGLTLTHHLIIASLFGLVVAAWSVGQLIPDHADPSGKSESVFFRLPNKSLVGIGLIAFCGLLGEGAMADWSTSYLENSLLAKEAIAPLGLVAFSTAMTLTRLSGDWGRKTMGDDTLLIISSSTAIVGMLIVIFGVFVPVVIFGFFLVGLGLAIIVPIAYSKAGSIKGIAPGLGISMVSTLGYSGFLFGPPIIGYLGDVFNLQVAFLFLLLLFAVMLFISWLNPKYQAARKNAEIDPGE